MNKIKKIILFSLLGILLVSPVFAAIQYPKIGDKELTASSTAADVVVYFFYLALAVGAFLAGAVLCMAGIEYVSARGEPAKLESARNKIKNSFLGLIILLASFMILNIINSQLTSVTINELEKTPEQEFKIPEGAGVYLYDLPNYKSSENVEPARITQTMAAFINNNFNNKAESIKFNNPTGGFKFGAVLFAASNDSNVGSGADLRGNCSYVLSDVPDLDIANGVENNPPVGKDKLASILIFNTTGSSGTIKIFNTIDCRDRTDEYGPTCKKQNQDDCLITGGSGFTDFKSVCPSFRGDIFSIKADKGLGILLKLTSAGEPGRCQYIEANDSGCINLIKYTYLYKQNDEVYKAVFSPKSFVIFSLAN